MPWPPPSAVPGSLLLLLLGLLALAVVPAERALADAYHLTDVCDGKRRTALEERIWVCSSILLPDINRCGPLPCPELRLLNRKGVRLRSGQLMKRKLFELGAFEIIVAKRAVAPVAHEGSNQLSDEICLPGRPEQV